jgi:hypothetical protein
MKKIVASVTALSFFLQAMPAMAWVGGPYSNNTHDGKTGGVFQGMVTMKNGSGMFRFSTGSEPFISPNANSVMFHQGLVFYGDCFGMVDFPSKRVSGVTNGNSNINFPANTPVTPIGTPSIQFGNGNDNYICNTQWSGRFNRTAPGVTFKAKGHAYIFQSDYSNQTTTDIITSGIIEELPGDPAPIRETTITQTISSSSPAPKKKVKIRVYGSRVSTIAYTAFGTATPTP